MTETPTFGEMIGIIRRKRGMRYADVSGSTHGVAGLRPIHRTEVMRIERDRRMNPKLTTLLALCAALDMRITIDPEGIAVEDMDEVRDEA